MLITNTTKEIRTILPDGSILETFVSPWGDGEHRIGEKKQIFLEYTTDFDISGFAFYINPALFMVEAIPNPITNKGNYYYAAQLPSVIVGGVDVVATLLSTAADMFLPTYKNFDVKVTPASTTAFSITIDFYMIHDLTAYVKSNGNTQNWKKFLNEVYYHTWINPTNTNIAATDTGSPNVYATLKVGPRVYFHMDKTGAPFPGSYISYEETFPNFRAGYYYKNATNTDPWFTNTYFEFKRGGNVVTNLSASAETEATIFATTSNALNPVTHFLVWIIRTDTFDNTVDFLTNYEAEFQWIKAANVSATKIKAPMTDPTNVSGNIWKATFKVDSLPYGSKYRFIGIAYSDTGGQPFRVNSFLTPEMTVDSVPTYDGNGFDVRAALDDYNRQFEGNDLECVIEERMRSKIKLEFPFDKWKNDIFARLGLVVGNDIRRYLTQVSLTIYEEYVDPNFGNVINIFDYKASNKIGVNTYSQQSGMTLNFSNSWAEFHYEWRNRFESWIDCLTSLVNGAPVLPVLKNQYWGGKTLKIKWNLQFTYDDYSTPFSEDIIIEQQIRVKDYGDMSVMLYDEAGEEFLDAGNVCNDGEICFAGVLDDGTLTDRKLMVNIFPEQSSVNVVEEAEVWEGNQLPQLTTPKIVNEDEDYSVILTEKAAKFCVDGNELIVNSQYQISALAKKFVDTGFRITEKENPSVFEDRITENNDKRIIDNL